jgi:hypothetical protein
MFYKKITSKYQTEAGFKKHFLKSKKGRCEGPSFFWVRQSVTSVNSCMGSGMLVISSALSKYGLINGLIFMMLSAMSLYIGLFCFRSLLLSYKGANLYSTLVEFIMGKVFC